MKPDLVWEQALGELQLQMTQATFDTWLRGACFLRLEDGAFVVGVRNEYAADWLGSRLADTIERTLTRLAGEAVGVRFEVVEAAVSEEEGEGGDLAGFVVPEFDVLEAGWFRVAEYEGRFWAPVLGRVAWRVVEIVRQDDRRGKKRTTWTPRRRYTAPGIAALVPCGRQALLGVRRRCDGGEVARLRERYEIGRDEDGWWYDKRGAFERLVVAGLAEIERRGYLRHTTYWLSVRNEMGLLSPEQAALLPDRLQVEHDVWLADHGFDPQAWDVEPGGSIDAFTPI